MAQLFTFSDGSILTAQQLNTSFNYVLSQASSQIEAASGKFYQDDGAEVARRFDRLLVGAAADNPAKRNRDIGPRDWLSNAMGATSIGAYAVWGAQGGSLARDGSIGWLAGSRTSDSKAQASYLGYTPSSIGMASWAIDDDTSSPRSTTAYAYYGEAWKLPGVGYQPFFAMELEVVDLGGGPQGTVTSYHLNAGGGGVAVQLGVGGGQTQQTWDAAAGLTFVDNPTKFQNGIMFGANSLTGVTPSSTDGGFANAIRMARNHAVVWDTPETRAGVQGIDPGLFIRSTVKQAVNGTRWEATDTGFSVSNNQGYTLFVVPTVATSPGATTGLPKAYVVLQSGLDAGACGVYAGGNGSPNLGLYPQSGGEIQTAGPVTAAGAKLSQNDVPAGGWLHININGTDVRVPLFSPAQAGG